MDRIQLLKEILIAVKERNCFEDFGLGEGKKPKCVTERERSQIVLGFLSDLCGTNWEDRETGILLEMIGEEIDMNFYHTRNLTDTYELNEKDSAEEERRDGFLLYSKVIQEHDIKCLTMEDFIAVCDDLGLPVFEVRTVLNPTLEPKRTTEPLMYKNMSEYRKQMPYNSARDYDYEQGVATYYLKYDGILDGRFVVKMSDNSADYKWDFEVVGQCVVVHSECAYEE